MQQAAKKYLTPEEYLALEDAAEYRSEYYQGEVFAMAGGSSDHNLIIGNFFDGLRDIRKTGRCRAFFNEMKIWIEQAETFTYPNLAIICGKPNYYAGRKDIVTNPLVLIEVLSDSTKSYDRGEKFEIYRSLPALREYIVVNQYAVQVQQFYREAPFRWILTEYREMDNILKFSSFDFQIPVRDIYDGVEFPPPRKK